MFRPVHQVAAPVGRQTALFSPNRQQPGGGNAGRSLPSSVTTWFTALQAVQDVATPEYLWKGTKTVLLEV